MTAIQHICLHLQRIAEFTWHTKYVRNSPWALQLTVVQRRPADPDRAEFACWEITSHTTHRIQVQYQTQCKNVTHGNNQWLHVCRQTYNKLCGGGLTKDFTPQIFAHQTNTRSPLIALKWIVTERIGWTEQGAWQMKIENITESIHRTVDNNMFNNFSNWSTYFTEQWSNQKDMTRTNRQDNTGCTERRTTFEIIKCIHTFPQNK